VVGHPETLAIPKFFLHWPALRRHDATVVIPKAGFPLGASVRNPTRLRAGQPNHIAAGRAPGAEVEGTTSVQDFMQIFEAVQANSTGDEPAEKRWQERANCLGVDPDLFFPERGASTREAKGVCNGCEVRIDCLEYALDHGEKFGIWGGMSERERRRLRRQRALARRSASA
jgi:WhiB family transcriptional regulator, redox-sensing transcriptional regulator